MARFEWQARRAVAKAQARAVEEMLAEQDVLSLEEALKRVPPSLLPQQSSPVDDTVKQGLQRVTPQ
jgi:hypothetical protein